ncbi:MAG: DNA cytosine methyltransferase [Sulfurovum sp.]|nr:DNA cytosine methyltransferase [Sulfurovum sp.]
MYRVHVWLLVILRSFGKYQNHFIIESGHDLPFEMLNAKDYGVAQDRKRVFLWALEKI